MKRKLAVAAILVSTVAGLGLVFKQQIARESSEEIQFWKMYHKANVDYGVIEPVFDSYTAMSGDKSAIKKAVRLAWVSSQKGDNSVFLVILAMQNQQLINQNERILSLLSKR